MAVIEPEEERLDLRIVKTRRAIEGAFRRQIETTEYSKITVSSLSREASINRKTFYAHYASVDDLLEKLIDEDVHVIYRSVIEKGGNKPANRGALETLTLTILKTLDGQQKAESSLVKGVPPTRLGGYVLKPLARIVREDRAVRGLPDITDIDYFAACYLGEVLGAFMHWKESGEHCTLNDLAKIVMRAREYGNDIDL